jgi:hypothetical protein
MGLIYQKHRVAFVSEGARFNVVFAAEASPAEAAATRAAADASAAGIAADVATAVVEISSYVIL